MKFSIYNFSIRIEIHVYIHSFHELNDIDIQIEYNDLDVLNVGAYLLDVPITGAYILGVPELVLTSSNPSHQLYEGEHHSSNFPPTTDLLWSPTHLPN